MFPPRKRPFLELNAVKIWENPTGTDGDVYLPKRGGVLSTLLLQPTSSTGTHPVLSWNPSTDSLEKGGIYANNNVLSVDQKTVIGTESVDYVPGGSVNPFCLRFDTSSGMDSKYWFTGPKLLESADKFLIAGYKGNSGTDETYLTKVELDKGTGKLNLVGGTSPGYQVNGLDVITSIPTDISVNSISGISTNPINISSNVKIASGKSIVTDSNVDLTLAPAGTGETVVSKLKSVEKISGQNGVYCEMTGSVPPLANFVSSFPWSVGASHSSNTNKQFSLGMNGNEGILYAWDQGGGGGGLNINIGYPSFLHPETLIWSPLMKLYRATITQTSLTTARTFTLPDKDGTFAMLSDIGGGGGLTRYTTMVISAIGYTSDSQKTPAPTVSRTVVSTGVYDIGFTAGITTVFDAVASINETGVYGFITVEYLTGFPNYRRVVIRNSSGVGINAGFTISFLHD